MNTLMQKFQAMIMHQKDSFQSRPRYYKALFLYFLLPCSWIGRVSWIPGIVKLLLDLAALYFALCIFLLGGFIILPVWYVCKHTRLFLLGKIGLSLLGAVITVSLLAYIVMYTPTTEQPSNGESTVLPQTETETPDVTPDIPDEQETLTTSEVDTEPKQEAKTPYETLTQNEESYLLFLKIIGTCYKDNTLTQEVFDEMASNSDVQTLVEDVLNYSYQNGTLPPDFLDSFSAFWDDDVASAHPEVTEALKMSFDLEYNLVEKAWVLKENDATITAHAENNTDATEDDFEWLPATGHLYPGVELYIVTDTTTTLYGVVTELDTQGTQVQIYLSASDEAQWFERRTDWFSDVLKVRSDDPHLPQY